MPTQTYTPTASWNNTSQYQQNGDVSDATVLQLTGEDAMDNIAYLTGKNTRTQVAQLWTVADVATLKGIGSSDRRDQDYAVLDDTKREYQFDSASAATGDDYSVITPTAGTGRWILQSSAVPEATTKRWGISAAAMALDILTGTGTTREPANGRVVANNGGTATLVGHFGPFNPGDVISELEFCANANVAGGGNDQVATFYAVEMDDGDTTPTVTTLATITISAGSSGATQTSGAPLPITIPAGTSYDDVYVTIAVTSSAGRTNYIYWAALNGTRAYIRE